MRVGGQAFRDTLLALERDQRRARLRWLVGVIGLLSGAWTLWAVCSHVDLVAVSQAARIEREYYHPVSSRVSGRITATNIALDREVKAGDVLVELDQELEVARLEEAVRRQAGFAPRIRVLKAEKELQSRRLELELRLADSSLSASGSKTEETRVRAEISAVEADRAVKLGTTIPELERLRLQAEAKRTRAALSQATAERLRVASEMLVRQNGELLRLERLDQELVALEADERLSLATVDVARSELERRKTLAAHDGKIIGNAALQVGTPVREGERLAVIVTPGALRVVAEFKPEEAVGRIHPAQRGTLRVAGFPWAQFGTLDARVSRVAAEPANGTIRVELDLLPVPGSRIPAQHGLEGRVEVAVDRMTPARLFAVMSGELLRSSRGAP